MLIETLKNHNIINRFICNECSDNSISIEVDKNILPDDLLIIKVDDYYNSLNENRPKSPDCLIIQRCKENSYNIYIIELRNIDSPDGFTVAEIMEKFCTCLDNFMLERFGDIFYHEHFDYLIIKLYFVSDPYHHKRSPEKKDKMRGTKIDTLLAERIPKYFGKYIYIEHKPPPYTIGNCKTK